jgi:hypothetical protein
LCHSDVRCKGTSISVGIQVKLRWTKTVLFRQKFSLKTKGAKEKRRAVLTGRSGCPKSEEGIAHFMGSRSGLGVLFFFLAVLGLELRAFTLSHSTSPFFVKGFSR